MHLRKHAKSEARNWLHKQVIASVMKKHDASAGFAKELPK
jgi:hypothetical protein